jgi:hypothetical protein
MKPRLIALVIRQIDEEGILTTELLPGFDLAAATIFER